MGQNNNAFSRSRVMFAAIMGILSNGGASFEQQHAIDQLAPYQSRGHGGKFRNGGVRHKIYAKMVRNNGGGTDNSLVVGSRECARRVRQALAISGKLS